MNLRRRRIFVPEVVQTSVMDCGPASLKCLAEGFGIPVSYGRLREACQTDVDGTSIDTMEEVAMQLGLEAEQIMAPADFVLLPEANLLPAIAVVLRASKLTHFVVAWRNHGALLQVMDPAVGRQWEPKGQFVSSLYIHTLPVSAQGWREWAESEKFTLPVRRKLDDLGISGKAAGRLIESALDAPGWRALARLEAGTRSLGAIVRSGGLRRGKEAERVLERLLLSSQDDQARGDAKEEHGIIPRNYWSAWPAPADDENGEERVFFKGAVLVHVKGRRSEAAVAEIGKLPPEVAAALEEKSSQPARDLLHMLKADGLLAPSAAVAALGLATLGVLIEAILFRSLLDMPREFGLSGQRLGVMAALLIFLTALMLLELPIASGILRIGRHLEARLRTTFLEKIPKLGDRYFHSRLTSDMAERSHSTHRIRLLPGLGGQLLRSTFELVVTVAGIIWLDVRLAVPALIAGLLAVALPLVVQPMLTERDLRVRNHTGALSRFYLDALLGLVPVLTHRAERALRREHQSLLVEWAHASFGLQRLAVWVEALQGLTGFGLAAWLMLDHISRAGEAGGALLLVYWALNLPGLGEEIAQVARQYPSYRNVTLRLLEPIGALEDKSASKDSTDEVSLVSVANQFESAGLSEEFSRTSGGVAIELAKVNVNASGHTILEDINLKIGPGDHVAIVGASGAGKSSLLGLFLGWYRPAEGSVLVDGAALEGAHLDQLRQRTAWIDPAVQLWNHSLFSNLCYGNPDAVPTADLLEQAELRHLLEKLPDGMQTELGESGGLVSGGEGQRVRFGRALLKRGVRLVLLDEPFRGLDRHQRRELLARARHHWKNTTLLCVTHDVGETLTFPRTLVIENGRIVEDGNPAELARQPISRYRALLEAEENVREGSWSSGRWRRLRLEDGRLIEELQRVSV